MLTRSQLLDHWHKQLADLTRRADGVISWRNRLHAKVLQYLIDRYEDPRRWNKHAGRRGQGRYACSLPSGGSRSQSVRHSKWQPRAAAELRAALDRIQAGNLESYEEYGLN